MSREHLIVIPSIPAPGPDRDAFIASLVVRVDELEGKVRALENADDSHTNDIAAIRLSIDGLRIEISALRTAGDEKLRAIKIQLDDSAELIGSIMRSQAKVEANIAEATAKHTEMIGSIVAVLESRLPAKEKSVKVVLAGMFLGGLLVGALFAALEHWPLK